jgi:hypothetical protein
MPLDHLSDSGYLNDVCTKANDQNARSSVKSEVVATGESDRRRSVSPRRLLFQWPVLGHQRIALLGRTRAIEQTGITRRRKSCRTSHGHAAVARSGESTPEKAAQIDQLCRSGVTYPSASIRGASPQTVSPETTLP